VEALPFPARRQAGHPFQPQPDNDVRYLFDTIGLSKIMKDCTFTDLASAEKAFQQS